MQKIILKTKLFLLIVVSTILTISVIGFVGCGDPTTEQPLLLAPVKDSGSGKFGFIKKDGSDLFPTNNFRYDSAGPFSKVE